MPARNRSHRVPLARFTVLLASAMALAGCGVLTPPPPATEQAEQVNNLYLLIFGIAIVIFVAVEGLILWSVIRYRRRDDDRLPSQFHGNTMLEVIWTAIPTLIVIIIFVLSLDALATVEERSDELGATITVEAFQWQWAFTYAGDPQTAEDDFTLTGTLDDPAVLAVPVRERVRVILDSSDVTHAFFVPQFLIKRDVNPNDPEPNTLEFTVKEVGEYTGQCAEYCGVGHADMRFIVQAMERADFDAWVAAQGQPAASPGASPGASPAGPSPVAPTASPSPASSPAGSVEPRPEPSPTGPAAGALTLAAENNEFSTDQLAVPADQPFTLTLENRDEGIPHNVSIYRDGEAVFTGEIFNGVDTFDYEIPALEPGEYEFRCDVHPTTMVGTLTVE